MGIQVRQATGYGENSFFPYQKPFISFKYGDYDIEHFDLLATISGDRMSKGLYSEFEDYTSDYTDVDGQEFWGFKYKPLKLSFILSTDGISERKLQEFTQYFKPGIQRQLILAQHENRKGMARVESVPTMELLPFRETVTAYGTSFYTTLYKGDIKLSLILDYPFWEGINAFISPTGTTTTSTEDNSTTTNNDNTNNTSSENDTAETNSSETTTPTTTPTNTITADQYKVIYEDGLVIADTTHITRTLADAKLILDSTHYFDTVITSIGSGLQVGTTNPYYVFYCGTAPCAPTLRFVITCAFNDTTNYISYPSTQVGYEQWISIGTNSVKYTSPNIYTSYNQVLDILNSKPSGYDLITLRNQLIEKIVNRVCRNKICSLIEQTIDDGQTALDAQLKADLISDLKDYMPTTITVEFNSLNGNSNATYIIGTGSSAVTYNEPCGDMVQSGFLKISTRTLPNESTGVIVMNQCLKLATSHDITGFLLTYKNMYL